jgi:TfoX/Sxy family transcriptional regulator of competence genes
MPNLTIDDFSLLLARENVTQKKTFGMPSLFVNGNMFLFVTETAVTYKLNEAAMKRALEYTGAKSMQMKGWVEIPFSAEADWFKLAEQALEQVSTLPPKEKKKPKVKA